MSRTASRTVRTTDVYSPLNIHTPPPTTPQHHSRTAHASSVTLRSRAADDALPPSIVTGLERVSPAMQHRRSPNNTGCASHLRTPHVDHTPRTIVGSPPPPMMGASFRPPSAEPELDRFDRMLRTEATSSNRETPSFRRAEKLVSRVAGDKQNKEQLLADIGNVFASMGLGNAAAPAVPASSSSRSQGASRNGNQPAGGELDNLVRLAQLSVAGGAARDCSLSPPDLTTAPPTTAEIEYSRNHVDPNRVPPAFTKVRKLQSSTKRPQPSTKRSPLMERDLMMFDKPTSRRIIKSTSSAFSETTEGSMCSSAHTRGK